MRTITLRQEVRGDDQHNLWARIDNAGDLILEGQNLGPCTALASDDGEYEWTETIAHEHVPGLLGALGADAADDVLGVLERGWTGLQSYELERIIRERGLRSRVWTWS